MNKNIEQLYQIAKKESRTILGLMSGTSLDGLDMALCKITNAGFNTKLQMQAFASVPFSEKFKQEVKQVFSTRTVDLQTLALLNVHIAETHAEIINAQLAAWNLEEKPDILASHGQSIFHAPKSLHQLDGFGNATLQIGDADHLAVRTGIICVSDFRQKHVAAGGEGAPLAAYGDMILFKSEDEDVILLNIGGISNFSFIPCKGRKHFSTDVGPGNGLMDAWMQKNFPGVHFDRDAEIAKSGQVQQDLLDAMKQHPYFSLDFPKTTGPELFNLAFLSSMQKKSNTENISVPDVMATLNRLTAETIAEALNRCIDAKMKTTVYVSGGGIHNPVLMDYLTNHVQAKLLSTAEKNIPPDAKEAVLFALLANEALVGDPAIFKNEKVGFPAVSMGKISFPF